MLPLINLRRPEYDELKSSGKLQECYPEATGDYENDVEIPYKESVERMFAHGKEIHRIWHKFSGWLTKTYGKDLYGDWVRNKIKTPEGKKITFKYRNFDDYKLSQRLCGYEVMERIEKYVKRCCPEIKIVYCDDEVYATSIILLIPHPKHGITMMYIPQLTGIQNRWFLYGNHYKMLMTALEEMKYVYEKEDLL